MVKYLASIAAVAAIGLSGCATTEPQAAATGQAQAAAPKGEKQTLVGTRLERKTTERIVRSVGNTEYKETNLHQSLANNPAVGKAAN